MSLTREDPELERPIEDPSQLLNYFHAAEKPKELWRVGTEHEKLGLYRDTLEPVPYHGERGIATLFGILERDHGFAAIREGDAIVGLEKEGTSITLEPGGQLELSGAPLFTMQETCKEFRDHIALMNHVCEPLGIVWLGLGVHPLANVDDLPRMPRERHRIMHDYLSKRGELALQMMYATGGVQANFDYASQTQVYKMLRMALSISPIVSALYANSSIELGKPNGFESKRSWVWRYTDPDRCGLLPFVFSPDWAADSAYQLYAEWALDVPMFLIQRDGRHIEMHGRSFREHMRSGTEGMRATMADWNLHLTTLFPEVRLKRVVEVRDADAVPPDLVCALPAFWKGLFYDSQSLDAAFAKFSHWTFDEVDALHAEVARRGLQSVTPDGPILELVPALLDLSAAGLDRLDHYAQTGETERAFLDPLYATVDRGISPGARLLERWERSPEPRSEIIIEYAAY